jgi:hypothetical protein
MFSDYYKSIERTHWVHSKAITDWTWRISGNTERESRKSTDRWKPCPRLCPHDNFFKASIQSLKASPLSNTPERTEVQDFFTIFFCSKSHEFPEV